MGDNAPIDLYSVSTGEVRTIEDIEAVRARPGRPTARRSPTPRPSPGADMKSGITLIDADGTNPRPLTTDEYVAEHGIGITWSPRAT